MTPNLEFQNGRLAKINGARPEYMDGYALLAVLQDVAGLLALRPISTCPKDGTFFIAWGPSGYNTTPLRCEVCRWYPEYRPLNPLQTHSNDAFTDSGEAATHWSPLLVLP